MDAWRSLRSSAFPSGARYATVRGDEDVEQLKQPLISGGESSDDDEHDEEAGLLRFERRKSDRSACARVPTQRHYDTGNRGYLTNIEPKVVRVLSALTALAASAFLAPFSPAAWRTATAAGTTTRMKATKAAAANRVVSIRAAVRTRRKAESADDMTETALVWMAMLTVAVVFMLVLGVAAHAP